MVTSAPARRLAHALAALAVAGPAALMGGVAWADTSPAPDAGSGAAAASAPADPVAQPSVGTWITGGTLLEGSQDTVAPKPATATHTTTRTHRTATRATSGGSTSGSSSSGATSSGPTVLPFTGGHVQALLPTGIAMLAGGTALMLIGRPRRVIV